MNTSQDFTMSFDASLLCTKNPSIDGNYGPWASVSDFMSYLIDNGTNVPFEGTLIAIQPTANESVTLKVYYNNQWNDVGMKAQIDTKQNTITDLSTIRSGATSGATAYQKPSNGIPSTDLASAVQTSLGKADTAIQSHQDISGKEDKTNKVITISSSSTDAQYPSAKAVFDALSTKLDYVAGDTIAATDDAISAEFDNRVAYTAQTKTDAEKTVARTNIGAASLAELQAICQYGTSANRPTTGVAVGTPYFDIDLGRVIFVKAVSGNTVTWVDSRGFTPGPWGGATANRPIGTAGGGILDATNDGAYPYYDTSLNEQIFASSISSVDGSVIWRDARGYVVGSTKKEYRRGTFAEAEAMVTDGIIGDDPIGFNGDEGYPFFATDKGTNNTGAMIYYTGSGWIYADGTTVS